MIEADGGEGKYCTWAYAYVYACEGRKAVRREREREKSDGGRGMGRGGCIEESVTLRKPEAQRNRLQAWHPSLTRSFLKKERGGGGGKTSRKKKKHRDEVELGALTVFNSADGAESLCLMRDKRGSENKGLRPSNIMIQTQNLKVAFHF